MKGGKHVTEKVKVETEKSIRPSAAKDEFTGVAESFKDSLNGLAQDELKQKLGDLQLELASNDAAQRADPDLKQARGNVTEAARPYAELRRELKLKAKLITRHLADSGEETAEEVIKNEQAAKALSLT